MKVTGSGTPTGSGRVSAKRVSVVSLKLVRESTFLYPGRQVRCPGDAAEVFRRFLGNRDREHFAVLCLDVKHWPVSVSVVSVGDLSSAIVHPREVFKAAVLSHAAAVIAAHNHPSDDVTPSLDDLRATERLREPGRILGIEVLDHVTLGRDGVHTSLREETDWGDWP